MSDSGARNRLGDQDSPYLKQHAGNPVDWYSWGEEALEMARTSGRPILLSIGYSACHWCHVMERESFEDDGIARLMNDLFVNIKVDREERPDLDAIYMNYVQMTTGHGGWPLTVFLTPELVPFYGGTYFPPDDQSGRPGFRRVLQSVAGFFQERHSEVEENRQEITRRLSDVGQPDSWGEASPPGAHLLDSAFYAYLQQLDNRYGGFGQAPKFPSAMGLGFLIRYASRNDAPTSLEAVTLTLDRMAAGGIYDQLGGGFHRYSVDDEWLVPHFEKMLYDNALLARTYLEAFQLTGRERYRRVVLETLAYAARELRHPEGGFYAAQDADSEGEEGLFYCWSPEQIESVLEPELTALFSERYDVTASGNWEGRTILRQVTTIEELARRHEMESPEVSRRLARAGSRLLEVRNDRVRPGLDDKILASWNGLMLTAFAEAAFVLNDPRLKATALKCADFLANEMIVDGRVRRSWQQGRARLNGYLEDYTHLAAGFLSCFQLTSEIRWLDLARELTEQQIRYFSDDGQGAFYFTSSDHEKLLVRHKEFFDNATPCGNSMAARNLVVLAELTGEEGYRSRAERLLTEMAPAIERFPTAFGNWLQALDFLLGPVQQLSIVGPCPEPLLVPARRTFAPARVIVCSDGADPALAALPMLEGKTTSAETTAYLCENYSCRQPVTDPDALQVQLGESRAQSR